MPYFCRSLDLAGAEPRRAEGDERARRSSSSASPTSPTSATCASRRPMKLIELLQQRGRRRRLPRPARAGVRRARAELRRSPRAGGLRLRRDRDRPPLASTTRDLVDDAQRRRRLPQRDRREGHRGRRQGLEAVSRIRIGQVGLGYWGPNLARNFDELGRPHLALRPRRRALRDEFARALPERARRPADFDELLADDDARRGRGRDAGADALRAREAGARGGQARLRREAAGDARRRDGRARRARRASATSC